MLVIFKKLCQIGIFIIFAQAIIHFRPKAVYEKYLRLLLSAIILVQMFEPVSTLFSGENGIKFSERVDWWQEALELGMEEALLQAEETNRILEKWTLEEIENRMENQEEAGTDMQTDTEKAEEKEQQNGTETLQEEKIAPIKVEVNIDE